MQAAYDASYEMIDKIIPDKATKDAMIFMVGVYSNRGEILMRNYKYLNSDEFASIDILKNKMLEIVQATDSYMRGDTGPAAKIVEDYICYRLGKRTEMILSTFRMSDKNIKDLSTEKFVEEIQEYITGVTKLYDPNRSIIKTHLEINPERELIDGYSTI